MAIEISCTFVGGPQGDETLRLHQFQCFDNLSLEIGWLKPAEDGGVLLMNGQRPRNVEWLAATQAVYKKTAPVTGGIATYDFTGLKEVRRCERVLENKGRLCRHEALDESPFCKTHATKKFTHQSGSPRQSGTL